jgi:hypothetical protein
VGFLAEWGQFTEQIRPLAEQIPWMTAIGNHEMGTPTTFIPGTDSGGECGRPYSAYFPMPAPADSGKPDTPWYAFSTAFTLLSSIATFFNFYRMSLFLFVFRHPIPSLTSMCVLLLQVHLSVRLGCFRGDEHRARFYLWVGAALVSH